MSCIYEIKCNDCGEPLDHSISMDSYSDIYIVVDACEYCIKQAVDKSIKETTEE